VGDTAVVIVAAGRGARAGCSELGPKQYRMVGGQAVLARTLRVFMAHAQVGQVIVVRHGDDGALYHEVVTGLEASAATGLNKLLPAVIGGATRQASVLCGLHALAQSGSSRPSAVLIHDAARPFVSMETISRVIDGLGEATGAVAAEPLADTLKRQADGLPARVADTVAREGLWRAQTPQGFGFAAIHEAHCKAAAAGLGDFTDDSAIAEWAGLDIVLVRGAPDNVKLTTGEDLAMAEARLRHVETRTGTGFDVHRTAAGDHVWLCGVRIAHEQSLDGHSDADVGLHALTDALLGAIGDGDIGQHFPPSDPQWKGAASDMFLADAGRRVAQAGGRIVNVDVTLLCETPKIGPHRAAMRARIADILSIDVGRVGVKATTTERLGFTGRGEGIAAMASASVEVPV